MLAGRVAGRVAAGAVTGEVKVRGVGWAPSSVGRAAVAAARAATEAAAARIRGTRGTLALVASGTFGNSCIS